VVWHRIKLPAVDPNPKPALHHMMPWVYTGIKEKIKDLGTHP